MNAAPCELNIMIISKDFLHSDVVLIRSNPISNDPRALKLLNSLSKKYRVVVLGWDREGNYQKKDIINNKFAVNRFKLRAPYGKATLVFYYPFFWIWVFLNLLACKPRFVHACDLDSLIPSIVYGALFSTKMLFDSFDRYAMAFIPCSLGIIYKFVDILENKLACKADALVTVSEKRLAIFGKYRPKFCEIIWNCPEDKINIIEECDASAPKDGLTLVYAGSLTRDRGLSILSKALHGLSGVRLILAGIASNNCINQISQNPNIEYVGLLDYDEALKLQASADVIPILYDPLVPINSVASPNKLFEAMMLGVPVVTNFCSEIVNSVGCGLVVEYDLNSVKAAVLLLRKDVSKRREMGVKGRLAFEKKYNWASMEKKLINLYERLIVKQDE
jgi:glycosyltransferase involved in cell wall biosynthesis